VCVCANVCVYVCVRTCGCKHKVVGGMYCCTRVHTVYVCLLVVVCTCVYVRACACACVCVRALRTAAELCGPL